LLIEDAAQAWLASTRDRPVGAYGDLSIFCLYKTIAIPDGAAAMCTSPLPRPGEPSGSARVVLRRVASSLGASTPGFAPLVARVRARAVYDPVADFAMTPSVAPSVYSRFVLDRYDTGDIAARRRHNYEVLRRALDPWVAPPFSELPAGASPMCFPVSTTRKREVIARLAELGIDVLDFWSHAHPLLDQERYPFVAELRQRIVGLPVHQDLTPADLDRIVAATEGA
jgi:dTDP-4-amino-4,6-dideoxygalactose transaminase